MPPISAVLFDFGNVLSGPPSPAIWQTMRTESGLDEPTLYRAYWAPRDAYDRGTLDSYAYWEHVAADAHTHFSPETIDTLTALDVELWTDMNQPMLAWVRQLHLAGIRTGILSNIGDAMAAGIRQKFDWIGNFHHAVWSHALQLRKPEPEIYAAAIRGLAVPASEILFLDDKPENIAAAEHAGMQGLLYRDHDAFEQEMRHRGWVSLLHPQSPPQPSPNSSIPLPA